MIRSLVALALFSSTLAPAAALSAQQGPYKILADKKVAGAGSYDYVYADQVNRRLYIPRLGGADSRLTVFDLDTLAPVKEIAETGGHGVAVDHASNHGFVSSSPVVMFDARTFATLKTIPVQGRPDGIEEADGRIYVLSHAQPNVTVLDAKDGSMLATIDAGGAVEQAVSDGKGHLFIDLEDKAAIAVIDTAKLQLTGTYDLSGKGDGCAGLAIDRTTEVLFAACSEPNVMVMLSARDGKIFTTLPIGKGADGATFNPATKEAFTAQGDGTFTVIKENAATSFAVEQTLETPKRARTITLDKKTGHIFTVTAEFGPAPALQPGQKYSRPPMIPDTFQIIEIGR